SVSTVAFDLPARPDLAPLEVVLRSQTGRSELAGLALTARDPRGVAPPQTARMREARSDGSVRYVFEALAAGEWEVELAPTPYLPPWEHTRARALAGGPALEFLCLDRGAPE